VINASVPMMSLRGRLHEEQRKIDSSAHLPPGEEGAGELSRRTSKDQRARGGETVLLVDDELAVRALAARVLRRRGYTVLEAADGQQALQVFQEHSATDIALLLTDVVMPQMNGDELASQLLALRPDLKVLFMSGYTASAVLDISKLNPNTAFLPKPFLPTMLADKVRDLLDS
jgi:two-component system, cell cycle sensor histidine kinase and response regulator CckA